MPIENILNRINSEESQPTTAKSRLVALRDRIVEILSLGRDGGQFCEDDFIVSASWFPAQDYSELVSNGGAVFVLARPSSMESMAREVGSVVREDYQLQIGVIFAARNAVESDNSRIELHVKLCEEIQDKLTTAADDLGYRWISASGSRGENSVPYHFMEMAEGTFCAFMEVRYFKVFKYT